MLQEVKNKTRKFNETSFWNAADEHDDLDDVSDEAIMEYLLAENHVEYRIINEY